MARKLTPKQEAYKNNRITGMGVSESYIAAYHCKTMSKKAISVEANKLEHDPRISLGIKEATKSLEKDAIMTREEVLERLSLIGRSSIKDVIDFNKVKVGEDEDGNPINQSVWEIKGTDTITDDQAAMVSEVTAGKDGLKIKTHNQVDAMKKLAEMEGWNAPSKHEIKANIQITDLSEDELDRKILQLEQANEQSTKD